MEGGWRGDRLRSTALYRGRKPSATEGRPHGLAEVEATRTDSRRRDEERDGRRRWGGGGRESRRVSEVKQ